MAHAEHVDPAAVPADGVMVMGGRAEDIDILGGTPDPFRLAAGHQMIEGAVDAGQADAVPLGMKQAVQLLSTDRAVQIGEGLPDRSAGTGIAAA